MIATKRGVYVECAVCKHQKQPIGRSAPLQGCYCDDECDGYRQAPHVGSLWPGETDADFGYPCGDAGTEPATPKKIFIVEAEIKKDELAAALRLVALLRKRIKLYKDSPLDHPNDLQMNWRVQEEIYATLCGFMKEAGLE